MVHQREASKKSSAKVKAVGKRHEVMSGKARKTSGGLTKKDLKHNKWGKIVSRKVSARAKKRKHLGSYLKDRPLLPHERR